MHLTLDARFFATGKCHFWPSGLSGHPRRWQQDSFVKASDDIQFSTGAIPLKVEMKNELMKIPAFVATFALLALTALNASAQTPTQAGTIGPANSVDTERIIRAFTAK